VEPRYGSLIMLPLLIPCAYALVAAGEAAAARARPLAVALVVAFSLLLLTKADDDFRATIAPPMQNWQAAADDVHGLGAGTVVMGTGYDVDLDYYLDTHQDRPRVRLLTPGQLQATFCSDQTPVVYVQDFTPVARHTDVACLRRRGAVALTPASVSPITVWYVPPPSASMTWCSTAQQNLGAPPAGADSIDPGRPFFVDLPALATQTLDVRVHVQGTRLTSALPGVGAAAGAGDPTCGRALPAFAAKFAAASPATAVTPGATASSFALYPLPAGVASGPHRLERYQLSWVSQALKLTLALADQHGHEVPVAPGA
jgi:hypothetical protein